MEPKKNKNIIICLLLIASLVAGKLFSTQVNAAYLTLTDKKYDNKTAFASGSMTVQTPRGNLSISFSNSRTNDSYYTNSGGLTVSCSNNGSDRYLCDASGNKKSSTTYAKIKSSEGRYTIAHFYVAYQAGAHRAASSVSWDQITHSNGTTYAHSATVKSGGGHVTTSHKVVYEIKINADMAGVSTASFGTSHQRRAKTRPILKLTEAARNCSITWNANGGSTPVGGTRTIVDGNTIPSLATTDRTGYSFQGWYTAASGGSQISANTTVVCGTSVTYYAHWIPNKVAITYKANGGSVSGTPTQDINTYTHQINYNNNINLFNTTTFGLTRTGYHIDGATAWNTKADGTGTSYNQDTDYSWNTFGDPSEATTSVTLYANWKKTSYTLTANPNGGTSVATTGWTQSGNNLTKSVLYQNGYGTLPNAPTRNNYIFTGWFTAATGGTKVTASTKMGAGNTTIYAHWSENVKYKIKYNSNGGSGSIPEVEGYVMTQVNLSNGSGFTKTANSSGANAYDIIGWSTDQFTDKAEYALGESYQITGNVTLYAVWRKRGTGFRQLPQWHSNMFLNCESLEGEKGTKYNSSSNWVDGHRAHIDGTDPNNEGNTFGYFTYK